MSWTRFPIKCLVCFVLLSQFLGQCASADEYNKLQSELNQADQARDWSNSRDYTQYQAPQESTGQSWPDTQQQYSAPAQRSYSAPPPVTPTPQSFAPSYMRPGMPYSAESIPALKNSIVWRMMHNPAAYGGAPAGQGPGGGNPFNLTPFGMLHYLWDDTTYVSAANPVTLYQTQSELQTAQQYSNMAQAAASRAKYARSPQERAEAAQQAQYYAEQAKQAAMQAQQVSQSGSLNPSDVAAAAVEQARAAQGAANQANNYAQRGF